MFFFIIFKFMYRMRHQNPDKSNNFFKQNVYFYENLNIIIQKILIWHLGGGIPIEYNYSIYPLLA